MQFQRGRLDTLSESEFEAVVREAVAHGYSETDARALARASLARVRRDAVWLSPVYQVNIGEHDGGLNLSIKRRDKAPILSRDHLVDLAGRFCRDRRFTPIELYPADERVVDTANQYHVWSASVRRCHAGAAIGAAMQCPGQVIANGADAVVFIPVGSERDWRAVQTVKNQLLGAAREAADLLLPDTRGRGVVLYAPPPGARIPYGFQQGLRSQTAASAIGAVQRPFD